MSPERKETINGQLIEEYYWAGKAVVYLDHHLVEQPFSFEELCEILRAEDKQS